MYLLDETPETEPLREQVLNLLTSDVQENLVLALQLIKGGGMHPSFILPLWAKFPNLPANQKRTASSLLKSMYANGKQVTAEENKLKFVVADYDYATFERVYARLQDFYPAHCSLENFALFFFPVMNKVAFFDFFYEKLPAMRVFLLEKMKDESESDYISFGGSRLACLPAEIGAFPALRVINIEYSLIKELPENFYTLSKLRYFHYQNTPLAQDEPAIKALKKRMPALEATRFLDDATNLYYEEEFKKAANKMRKAVSLLDNDALIWQWYGETHRMAELHPQSLEGFEKASALNPNSGYLWGKLAELKCTHKFYDEALQMCETFLQNPSRFEYSHSDEGDVLFVHGLVLFWLKRYDESIVAYQKSKALSNYAGTWYNLACSYSKKGDKTQMLAHLKEAFILDWDEYYRTCLQDEDKDFDDFYEDADFKKLLKDFKR